MLFSSLIQHPHAPSTLKREKSKSFNLWNNYEMLLLYAGIFATTCKRIPHGKFSAMIKKGASVIT